MDKKRNFDLNQRLYTRTFVCILAFVGALLILLRYTSLDSSSMIKPYFNHNPILISHSLPSSNLMHEENPISGHRKFLTYGSPNFILNEQKLSDISTEMLRNKALKGLGTVFVRGTAAMDELVVAHVEEEDSLQDLRLFLRTFHRSGMSSKADLVLIFSSDRASKAAYSIIYEESTYLMKLLTLHRRSSVFPRDNAMLNSTFLNLTTSKFNEEAFYKDKATSEPIWGSDSSSGLSHKKTYFEDLEIGLGSIVGFEASELNPDDNLHGFIENTPLQLRRWACYQMLLGMVKNKFKHVLLTSASGVLILNDPKTIVSKNAGLYLSLQDKTWGSPMHTETAFMGYNAGSHMDLIKAHTDLGKGPEGRTTHSMYVKNARHKKHINQQVNKEKRGYSSSKNSRTDTIFEYVYGTSKWEAMDNTAKNLNMVSSAAIIGEMSLIRTLANTMVTEIVKVALERKHRVPFPDDVLLSYLVHINNGVLGRKVLGNLHILENSKSFVHHVEESEQPSLISSGESHQVYSILAGNNKSTQWRYITRVCSRDICSSDKYLPVYNDCE